MSGPIKVSLDEKKLLELYEKYGIETVNGAIQITRTYMGKVQRDAREILQQNSKRDTGRLINSIQQDLKVTSGKVIGQVNAATKYARFIHEGAKHTDDEIEPFFVPFSVAPSLLKWAKRKGLIYQKTKSGEKRKRAYKEGQWYFKGKKDKEYKIDIKNGGLRVYHKPLKYLEEPFSKNIDSYLSEIANTVMENKDG